MNLFRNNPVKRNYLQLLQTIFLSLTACGFILIRTSYGYELDTDVADKFVQEIDLNIREQCCQVAVLKLADAYYYVRHANDYSENSQRLISCLGNIDSVANRIRIGCGNGIYETLANKFIKENMAVIDQRFLINWKKKFGDMNERLETSQVEPFLLSQIGELISKPGGDPAPVSNILLLKGGGYCNMFDYPGVKNQLFIYKLAYIMHVFAFRGVLDEYMARKSLTKTLRQLSRICYRFKYSGITEKQRQTLLAAMLSTRIIKPQNHVTVAELRPVYEPTQDENICKLLVEKEPMLQRLFDGSKTTIDFFITDCIGELKEAFQAEYAKAKWQIHNASLIDRWMNRLDEFFTRNMHFSLIERYLRLIVEEVPADAAKLAFEKGAGICNMIDNPIFKRVATIYRTMKSLAAKFLPGQGIKNNSEVLIKFFNFNTICIVRRTLR